MKHNTGKLLMTLGLLLLAAALALTAYNIWDEQRAAGAVAEVMTQVAPPIIAETEDSSEETTPTYVLHPNVEMPAVTVDDRRYIGVVSVPSLNLELPVIGEWDSADAKIAPCRYKGSAYTGDLIIAGHNYRTHFGPLKNIELGEEVLFTDTDGNVFTYRAVSMEVLPGTGIDAMEAGDWDLTLFTCTYSGQTRLTIRCVQI